MLVINATTGEFETGFESGGQTREHSVLVRALGITRLIVAVNKMDTVGWSQERFRTISDRLSAFLKTAGFREQVARGAEREREKKRKKEKKRKRERERERREKRREKERFMGKMEEICKERTEI